MKHKPTKTIKLHPNAQILVTGTRINPDDFLKMQDALGANFPIKNWIGADGAVGHIDSIRPGVTLETLQMELERISFLSFLDIGVTVMSGPPGVLVTPVISFSVKNGLCSVKSNVHMTHPPPRRIKTAIL